MLFIALLSCTAYSQPSIVFILADDMGNSEVGYNNPDWHTPNIDFLAENGVIFSAAYAQPQCTPSRHALLTGRYPFRDGMQVGVTNLWSEKHIPTTLPTLPEHLGDLGYMCGMVGKWHLGNIYPEYLPYNHGFRYWYGNSDGVLDYYTHEEPSGPYDLYENGEVESDAATYYTELIGGKAVNFINSMDSETPFFLYVAFTAPHDPYQAPTDTTALAPPSFSTNKKKKWAMVRIMDNEIGKILDALNDNGLEDSTIVVFYSDNGSPTTTYYHGTGVGDNSPYSSGKFTLMEGGCRVPAVWYQPGIVHDTISTPIHLIDMLPTFVSLAGGSVGSRDTIDGIDISPLVSGGSIATRSIVLNIIENRNWAVVQGDWKLSNNAEYSSNWDSTLVESIKLYNLSSDPTESTDVSGSNPDKVTELESIINNFLPSVATPQDRKSSPPPGWVNFPVIATPKTYYDADYYFFRPYK